MRARVLFVATFVGVPMAARADLTVFFPAPAPRAPLVATPVPSARAGSGLVVSENRRESVAVDASAPRDLGFVRSSVEVPSETGPMPSTSRRALAHTDPSSELTSPSSVATTAGCEPQPLVRFVRTTDGSRETRELRLLDCRGEPDPEALLELSILARPRTVERPSPRDLAAHASDPDYCAAEIRRLHPGLLVRLAHIAERFVGHDVEITSGYRPDARETSRHRTGQALDLRVVGAPLELVHTAALELDETGVGLYPTSEFIHLDVRPRVTRWVDLAGPGERARMVEIVHGRDGRAASAPPLRWPAVAAQGGSDAAGDVASSPAFEGAGSEPASLQRALRALDALEERDESEPRGPSSADVTR